MHSGNIIQYYAVSLSPTLWFSCFLTQHSKLRTTDDANLQTHRKSAGMPKSGAHIRRNALRYHGSISERNGRTAACVAHRLPVSLRGRQHVCCTECVLLVIFVYVREVFNVSRIPPKAWWCKSWWPFHTRVSHTFACTHTEWKCTCTNVKKCRCQWRWNLFSNCYPAIGITAPTRDAFAKSTTATSTCCLSKQTHPHAKLAGDVPNTISQRGSVRPDMQFERAPSALRQPVSKASRWMRSGPAADGTDELSGGNVVRFNG